MMECVYEIRATVPNKDVQFNEICLNLFLDSPDLTRYTISIIVFRFIRHCDIQTFPYFESLSKTTIMSGIKIYCLMSISASI